MSSSIALGTVQFGLPYGIANDAGKVDAAAAAAILNAAAHSGIDTLDTAIAYGDSEAVLGEVGVRNYRVVTKLPAIPDACGDVAKWVWDQTQSALARLKIESAHGILLHRPEQLVGPHGDALYQALLRLKSAGLTRKIGVSIYVPQELDALWANFDLDLVQAPLNIMDRRLVDSGWAKKIRTHGSELHVRSVFLQGLLLMPPHARPPKFDRWRSIWMEWDRWMASTGLTPLEACLRYVLAVKEVDRVVVGVDSLPQLLEILAAARSGKLDSLPQWPVDLDVNLLNPAMWNVQ